MKGLNLHKRSSAPDSPEAELKKNIATMDLILIILGIFLFLFVVTMVLLFVFFQQTPDVLIGAVFGFCGFECGAMAAIQRKKAKYNEKLEELKQRDQDPERKETP